jgi:hypothetical protein
MAAGWRIRQVGETRGWLNAASGLLGERAYADYNRQRREWHANLGPIKTPQLAALHEDLWDIVDSNAQDGDKAEGRDCDRRVPRPGENNLGTGFREGLSPPRNQSRGRADERWA